MQQSHYHLVPLKRALNSHSSALDCLWSFLCQVWHMIMDVASRPHMCSLTNAHPCLTLSPVLCLMLGLKEKSKDMASVYMELIQKQLLIFKDLIFKLL